MVRLGGWHGAVVFQKPVSFVWPIWPETPNNFKSEKDQSGVEKELVGCS